MYTAILSPRYMGFAFPYWEQLIDVLDKTDFEVLPAMSLGASPAELTVLDSTSADGGANQVLRAKGLMARRHYEDSAKMLRDYVQSVDAVDDQHVQRLALLASGLHAADSGSWSEFDQLAGSAMSDGRFADWLRSRLDSPAN